MSSLCSKSGVRTIIRRGETSSQIMQVFRMLLPVLTWAIVMCTAMRNEGTVFLSRLLLNADTDEYELYLRYDFQSYECISNRITANRTHHKIRLTDPLSSLQTELIIKDFNGSLITGYKPELILKIRFDLDSSIVTTN
ncbi:hypothetical protein AVEN_95647-1 [Araneus ventricosus]|uniref:Uncharacterized protein n=1 Tax=Araneus ventricosus TaxID=182803 RepID=A0A4Y2WZ06_ARAVE|nr:hypothetical protein AVEN_95647-1 [Araneus ventricosus]